MTPRTRWVLALAGLQVLVLVAGVSAAAGSGMVGFAALGAAWMFLGVRASRFALGDRRFDEEARRVVQRLRLAGVPDEPAPPEVAEAVAALAVHDRLALAASAGVAVALATGWLTRVWPGTAPWWFGLALVVVLGLLIRLWAWRSAWCRARAVVEQWWPERGRA